MIKGKRQSMMCDLTLKFSPLENKAPFGCLTG